METNRPNSNVDTEEDHVLTQQLNSNQFKPVNLIESTKRPSLANKEEKKLSFHPQLKSHSTLCQAELGQSEPLESAIISNNFLTQNSPSWYQLRQLARRHLSLKNGMGRMFSLSPSPSSQFSLTKNLTSGQTIMGIADQLRNTLLPKSLSSGDLFNRNRQTNQSKYSQNDSKSTYLNQGQTKTITIKKMNSVSTNTVNDSNTVNIFCTLVPKSHTDFCLSTSLSSQNDCLFFCALCLDHLPSQKVHQLICCGCIYCLDCLRRYVEISIHEHLDLLRLGCPSADCPGRPQNLLSEHEIRALCPSDVYSLYERLRKQQEVAANPQLVWCPRPDCEGVCRLPERWTVGCDGQVKLRTTIDTEQPNSSTISLDKLDQLDQYHNKSYEFSSECSNNFSDTDNNFLERVPVQCGMCQFTFCAHCRRAYHQQLPCQSRSEDESLALLLKRNSIGQRLQIKKCPQCAIFIQRDEGCAQMMCRKCKHVFCWFCMQSLEDDLLLRHYDQGPCKNKLGHSRLSVLWHRIQVIGIFVGFVLLLLLISPLFLLIAPFVFCVALCCGSKIFESIRPTSRQSVSSSIDPCSV